MVETVRKLVRPICTFAFVGDLIYLANSGKIEPKEFMILATMVVSFWFATRKYNSSE